MVVVEGYLLPFERLYPVSNCFFKSHFIHLSHNYDFFLFFLAGR